MEAFKHLFAVALGFAVTIAITIILAFLYEGLSQSRRYDEKLFDSVVWKENENDNERYRMMKDLQYYYLSNGMSIQEVTGILGEPELEKGDSIVSYTIGSGGILSFDQKLTFKVRDAIVMDFYIE